LYLICVNNLSICYVSITNKHYLIHLGVLLRQRREELSFSQNDVANMTGLTVNTIASFEKGRGTTLNNFLLICRALKIQPKHAFHTEMDLEPLYTLPPFSKKRIEITQKLDDLVHNTDFFHTPKRVSQVLEKLESDKADSNKFSVYLSSYCKEGELEYIKVGNVKKYVKKK